MADASSPMRHLKTYPTDGPLAGEDLARHKIAPGTVTEGMVPVARASHADGWTWSDSPLLKGIPLRFSLTGTATPISGTTSPVEFSKWISLPAGVLTEAGVGSVLRVTTSGPIATRVASPGSIGIGIYLIPSGGGSGVQLIGAFSNPLPWNQPIDRSWSVTAVATVLSTGTSGTLRCRPVHYVNLHDLDTFEAVSVSGPTTINMANVVDVKVSAQWGIADVANIIGLDTFIVELMAPISVVS